MRDEAIEAGVLGITVVIQGSRFKAYVASTQISFSEVEIVLKHILKFTGAGPNHLRS